MKATISAISLILLLIGGIVFFNIKNETQHYEKELTFIEKSNDSLFDNYIYFDSKEDKSYYYVTVDGWEYDNFKEKKGEVIKFKAEKKKFSKNEYVYIFDEKKILKKSSRTLE